MRCKLAHYCGFIQANDYRVSMILSSKTVLFITIVGILRSWLLRLFAAREKYDE